MISSWKFLTTLVVAMTLAASATAFAQAGGADVPGAAKAKGTMENGSSSTGMSKGKAMGTMKKHHMKKPMHHSM